MVDDDVDDNDEGDHVGERGKVLFVIDIQSGDIIQEVRTSDLHSSLGGEASAMINGRDVISAMLVDGDEIYMVNHTASKVVALRHAGSEA